MVESNVPSLQEKESQEKSSLARQQQYMSIYLCDGPGYKAQNKSTTKLHFEQFSKLCVCELCVLKCSQQ